MGNEKLPLKKAIPAFIAALIFVIGVSALMMKLNLSLWVVWMGMCLWAGEGMSMDIKDIIKTWLSVGFAVTMGYCLTSGITPCLIVGACIVLVFIFGMVSHRFPWLSNSKTATVLTACTAGMVLEPGNLAYSVAGGFILFGLIPFGASKLLAKKKAA